ncbi:rod shape-determining protein MreC [Thermocrinis sp.]
MKNRIIYFFLFLLSALSYLTEIYSYPMVSPLIGLINSIFLPVLEFKSQISYKVRELANTYVFLVNVQKENKRLLEEISRLNLKVSELETCKRELSQIKELEGFYTEPDYIIANVVAFDPSGRDEFIIVDRGKKDGIEEGFVVVNKNILVGIVDQVYLSSSRVRTVWSDAMSVSVVADGKNYIYKGGFPTGRLLHVLQEDDIKEGVRVLLRSPHFPSFEVGKVHGSPSLEEQFFKKVEVKPEADIRKIEFVVILRRKL